MVSKADQLVKYMVLRCASLHCPGLYDFLGRGKGNPVSLHDHHKVICDMYVILSLCSGLQCIFCVQLLYQPLAVNLWHNQCPVTQCPLYVLVDTSLSTILKHPFCSILNITVRCCHYKTVMVYVKHWHFDLHFALYVRGCTCSAMIG